MSRRLGDVALAVLAVVTVVLLGVLLNRQAGLTVDREPSATSPSGSASPSGSTSPSSSPSASPTPRPSASQTTSAKPATPASPRVADRRDGTLAHALTAACTPGGKATLTIVYDGRTEASPVEGLAAITGVQVVDNDSIRVIGGDAECEPTQATTSDRGKTWRSDDGFGFWSLVPGSGTSVANSSGVVTVPCTAVAVSGIDPGVGRVLCTDDRVLGTADAGETWVGLGVDAQAVSFSYATPAVGFALSPQEGCEGIAVRKTTDGGSRWEQVHCTDLTGPWAVSVTGDTVVVVGADGVLLSEDAGASWH